MWKHGRHGNMGDVETRGGEPTEAEKKRKRKLLRDDAGNEQTLQTSDEHPFWSVTDNDFVDRGKLHLGAKVTSPDRDLQTLVTTTRDERPDGVAVFNFQVDGFHTYYVSAATDSRFVLVHNAECHVGELEAVKAAMANDPTEFGVGLLDASSSRIHLMPSSQTGDFGPWRESGFEVGK